VENQGSVSIDPNEISREKKRRERTNEVSDFEVLSVESN
jgi:hypothetical protein